jgi:uncharacterized lipoprotein YddW (UPF0748 family)
MRTINGLWVHPERVLTPELADKTLDQAQRCRMTDIYVLVFHHEQAWFRTPHCPISKSVKEGFDPLGYCITKGHKRGMRVHAWFVNGQAGDNGPGAIMSEHPDWQSEDANGAKVLWFDFCKPEVRRFQKDLMLSAVTNYPELDGIHFDYIRYPNANLSYSPSVLKAFRKDTGFAPIRQDKFPLKLPISANPVHAVTTGTVLAEFGTGMPAVVENRLGKGRVLLLNWHAERNDSPALDRLLSAKLKEFGGDSRPIRLYFSPPTNESYGSSYRDAVAAWLTRLGYKWTGAQHEADPPGAGDMLVVANNYRWADGEPAALRKLVEEGMNLIWIDGPAVSSLDLMAILGTDRTDSFFTGLHVIKPVVDDPAMPIRADSEDPAVLEKQAQAWVQWRMDRVTDLVKDVYGEAKKTRPEVEVTAAVFYKRGASEGVLQDWQRWVREGYVDYVIPMAYVGDAELGRAFDEWSELPDWREKVVPGISIYSTDNPERKAAPQDAAYVESQVRLCKARNARGIVYFCCHYISPETEPVLKGAVGDTRIPPTPR